MKESAPLELDPAFGTPRGLPWVALALGVAGVAAGALFLDHWAYVNMAMCDPKNDAMAIYGHPWGSPVRWGYALKKVGEAPVWLTAAALVFAREMWLVKAGFQWAARRVCLLAGSLLTATVITEVVKVLVKRCRPSDAGEFVFRTWAEYLDMWRHHDVKTFSFPSGHATAAFAGAFVLCRLYPRLAWIWLPVAAGCAVTRVLDHAHYVSDVVGGACVGWFGAWIASFAVAKAFKRAQAWRAGTKAPLIAKK